MFSAMQYVCAHDRHADVLHGIHVIIFLEIPVKLS